MDKISVIIPVYNVQKFLEKCLKSVVEQQFNNLEIIIIDDGSTDNSLEICKRFKQKDNRIKIIESENYGVSHARNLGIEQITGNYVVFIDSDDYVSIDFISRLHYEIKKENADIIISGITMVSKNNELKTISDSEERFFYKEDFKKHFEELYDKNLINLQCNKMIKADIVKQCRLNENYISGEDYIFNLCVLKLCNSIKTSKNCGYFYRSNSESVSNLIRTRYTKHYELEHIIDMEKIEKEKLLDIGFSEDYINSLQGKGAFSEISKIARNIALYKGSHAEKKEKYKALLKNEELRNKIKKENIKNKKNKIVYLVYKSKNLILIRIYANLLILKSRLH